MFFKNKKKSAADKYSLENLAAMREKFLKKFIDYVENFNNIVIFQHINPDGDCIGCSLALKAILKDRYTHKKIYSVGNKHGLFPWLKTQYDILPADFDVSKALAIIVDVGTSPRIDLFNEYFRASDKGFGSVIKIDHHGNPSDFTLDLEWDDPTYVASACQIFQIAEYYSWEVSKKAATYLLLGIITDSGGYSYDSVLPRSLVIAAKLMRIGGDSQFLNRNLRRRTFHDIKVSHEMMSLVNKGNHLLWMHLTEAKQQELGIETKSGLVNVMAAIEDNIVWVLFTDKDGKVSVDFRSIGVSVRDVAIQFGGGGHENAAGCIIDSAEQIKDVVEALQKAVDAYIAINPIDDIMTQASNENSELDETIEINSELISEAKATSEYAKETLEEIKEEHADALAALEDQPSSSKTEETADVSLENEGVELSEPADDTLAPVETVEETTAETEESEEA